MTDDIVRAEIHPGIGVARIGNSEDWFLAPEVRRPTPRNADACRDNAGAILREAPRFRIYGYDATGKVVKELTVDNAEIEWNVHIASSKAQWFTFIAAMDRPEMESFKLRLRNPNYDPHKRGDLRIDPGPVSISGKEAAALCKGAFRYQDTSVSVLLGELKTDEAGRLIVLAGKGESGSPTGLPAVSTEDDDWFGNTTGWYDDIADGPVTAKVKIDGRDIHCSHAWVASAPPNFAPDLIGWRTLDDMMQEVFVDAGWVTKSAAPSFAHDIYPLFERLVGLQWVNQGIANIFGAGGQVDFSSAEFIDKISRIHDAPNDSFKTLRSSLAALFRAQDSTSAQALPPIYGDTFGTIGKDSETGQPGNLLGIWDRARENLASWVAGKFSADWVGSLGVETFETVPLAAQPMMLDRAAMHFCLADAFHPGCELTWPLRHATVYEAPYRIRMRAEHAPEQEYGTKLSRETVLSAVGPLHSQGPGDLTRWMALPWQMDTLGCRSGYQSGVDPYLPTFWPARVPNHVLNRENYDRLMDKTLTRDERLSAFAVRDSWYATLGPRLGFAEAIQRLVHHLDQLGIICQLPGPDDASQLGLPFWVYVECLHNDKEARAGFRAEHAAFRATQGPPSEADVKARTAGWLDDDERRFFLRARFPRLSQE
jgi:L-Lysine epsilon oxidase N-terminal/L-lysine epsilon oxidase C-terminal domain